MRRLLPALAAAALLTGGCGYIGEPQPPLANVPSAVLNLTAVERGDVITGAFTLPELTTEGLPVQRPLTVDLRAGVPAEPFHPDAWAEQARRIPVASVTNGVARYRIPVAEFVGKSVVIGVRVAGPNGKESNWSNFLEIPVVAPLEQPRDLRADATPQGVRLAWSATGEAFRILRRAEGETAFTAVATVQQREWTDPQTDFGKHYDYEVQTIANLGGSHEAESAPSESMGITPEDVFPPARPAGLRAAAAPNSIELNWNSNTESFLGGYRVYRTENGGAFEKIADVGLVPSYSDRGAVHGKTYRYAVSAVSKTGYESPRSEEVEVRFP